MLQGDKPQSFRPETKYAHSPDSIHRMKAPKQYKRNPVALLKTEDSPLAESVLAKSDFQSISKNLRLQKRY
jgi:hypothetical protein